MTLTERRVYLDGALEARVSLCRAQVYVHGFGRYRPRLLWQQLMLYTGTAYPPALVRGFVDMTGVYPSLALERSDIDPVIWELMIEVERLHQIPCGSAGNQLSGIRRAARSPHHAASSETEQSDRSVRA